DNASRDGSAEAIPPRPEVRVIARDRRAGLAENYTILLREARGELCLLLNEDTELADGAGAALAAALRDRPDAGGAAAPPIRPDLLPLLGGGRLPATPPRRRLGGSPRAGRPCRPSPAAPQRQVGGHAADRRVPPRPRRVHAKAPFPRGGGSVSLPLGLVVPGP